MSSRQGTRITNERLRFEFDGRPIEAQRGDSVASALLANGVRLVGRSVKYRRPRGIYSAGVEEPNALVTVGRPPALIPNVPAPALSVSGGLEVFSQNRWPSLRWNVSSLLAAGGRFLGAGFYYKTFMWPSWRAYEGLIRRLAGLGAAPRQSSLARVDMCHLECDLLVIGAGPAGLSAALAAARGGERVILCERDSHCGGELEFETAEIDGQDGLRWVASTLQELAQLGARVFTDTAVVAGSERQLVAHRQPGGLPGRDSILRLRARGVIAATGAVEYPLAFGNNDAPGVMLLGAAERYLARYGVRVGRRAVLFGAHDRLYAAARRLLAGGIEILMIVDARNAADAASSELARRELKSAGIECLLEHGITSCRGRLALRGITVSNGTRDAGRIVACDALLISGGWAPCSYAPLMSRAVCGAAAGQLDLGALVNNAFEMGSRVLPLRRSAGPAPLVTRSDPAPQPKFWRAMSARGGEKHQFVDLQNDVTVADLRQALEEGFCDIEHLKRYTTLGVGTEQGRISRRLGAAIIADLTQTSACESATSRARAPYQPVPLQALCGRRAGAALKPERRTPLHEQHRRHGAVFESFGLWLRPRYYRASGADAQQAGIVEARRVRAAGGILDASTLGKIEIAGPGAEAFLDRTYLTPASRLKEWQARYAVLLREDGMVLDDGLLLKLSPERFMATVSSSHTEQVLSHLEYWCEYERRGAAVTLSDITDAWAVIVVAGPASRDALKRVLGAGWRRELDTLRHMRFACGEWQGRPVRLLRASYSGELAYEVHCRSDSGPSLWRALSDAGLSPFGLEALDILRVEKGYLGSSEMNGQTTARDLGLEEMLLGSKACVGHDAMKRAAFADPNRPRLVGLQTIRPAAMFQAGAHLALPEAPAQSVGHITSAVYSPTLSRWVGLGLLKASAAKINAPLLACDPLRGREEGVTVVPAAHFDPAGERMKA